MKTLLKIALSSLILCSVCTVLAQEKQQEPKKGLHELLDQLKSEDTEARCKAAEALGGRNDRRAVKGLIELLADRELEPRFAAQDVPKSGSRPREGCPSHGGAEVGQQR